MAEAKFTYEGQDIIIQCNKNQKMKDICTNLSNKINVGINSLIFLYGGNKLDLEKTFNELTKENVISIIAYEYDNEEISKKYGRILNDEIINSIYLLIPIKDKLVLLFEDIISFIISLFNTLPHFEHISSFSFLYTIILILFSFVSSWNVFSMFNIPPPYKNTNEFNPTFIFVLKLVHISFIF